MRYHAQNLNESRNGEVIGSIFFHGRAWFKRFLCEWLTFHKAKGFSATISFGQDDDDRSLMFHLCLPFLFSIYFTIGGMWRCKSCKTGFAIHNGAAWLYLLPFEMETSCDDPWYRKTFHWDFPWTLDWYSTEILTQNTPALAKVVWTERRGDRKRRGIDSFKMMDESNQAAAAVTEEYDYRYTLKNGEVQLRKAKIFAERRTWRARWWPLIPRRLVRTSIDVHFNEEVGERTGSWKGGCVGCGYEMLSVETPLDCLARMEIERKFN